MRSQDGAPCPPPLLSLALGSTFHLSKLAADTAVTVFVASSLTLATLCLSFLLCELIQGHFRSSRCLHLGSFIPRLNIKKLQGNHKAGFAQSSHQQGVGTGSSIIWAVVKCRLRAAMERGSREDQDPIACGGAHSQSRVSPASVISLWGIFQNHQTGFQR